MRHHDDENDYTCRETETELLSRSSSPVFEVMAPDMWALVWDRLGRRRWKATFLLAAGVQTRDRVLFAPSPRDYIEALLERHLKRRATPVEMPQRYGSDAPLMYSVRLPLYRITSRKHECDGTDSICVMNVVDLQCSGRRKSAKWKEMPTFLVRIPCGSIAAAESLEDGQRLEGASARQVRESATCHNSLCSLDTHWRWWLGGVARRGLHSVE
jgi:hypothetical protein